LEAPCTTARFYSFLLHLHRRPPAPPLFPYTTLFRSIRPSGRQVGGVRTVTAIPDGPPPLRCVLGFKPQSLGEIAPELSPKLSTRSEEHTSELQSRENLVCRLLLEKKKKE